MRPCALDPRHRARLTDTAPAEIIGPHPQWADPSGIVSLDPFGALVADVYRTTSRAGTTSGDDRDHQREHRSPGDPARPRGGPPSASTEGSCAAPARRGDEGGIERSGICPAWHAVRLFRGRPAATLFEETGGMFSEL